MGEIQKETEQLKRDSSNLNVLLRKPDEIDSKSLDVPIEKDKIDLKNVNDLSKLSKSQTPTPNFNQKKSGSGDENGLSIPVTDIRPVDIISKKKKAKDQKKGYIITKEIDGDKYNTDRLTRARIRDNYETYICCNILTFFGFSLKKGVNFSGLLLALNNFVDDRDIRIMNIRYQFLLNISVPEIEPVAIEKMKINALESTTPEIGKEYFYIEDEEKDYIHFLTTKLRNINAFDYLNTCNDSIPDVRDGNQNWRKGTKQYRVNVVLMEYFQSGLRESIRIQVQLTFTNIDSLDSRIPLLVPVYMYGFIYRKDNLL